MTKAQFPYDDLGLDLGYFNLKIVRPSRDQSRAKNLRDRLTELETEIKIQRPSRDRRDIDQNLEIISVRSRPF